MRFLFIPIIGLGVGIWSHWFLDSQVIAEQPFIASYERFYATKDEADELAGQVLLTELNCTACHLFDENLRPKGGPIVQGSGNRLSRDWIRSFLSSPSQTKSGSTMPHLLHLIPESEREVAIDALVAFLSFDPAVAPPIIASGANPVAHEFWLKGDPIRGRLMYHQVGCVSCHSLDHTFQPAKKVESDFERKIAALGLEVDELEEMGLAAPQKIKPVPMSNISKKYSLRSLSMFLIAPHIVRPAGRMPSFKLQPHEAADIAAYLFASPTHSKSQDQDTIVNLAENQSDQPASVDKSLVDAGRQYFSNLSCANCHPMPGIQPKMSRALKELTSSSDSNGCLNDSSTSAPRFGLTKVQVVDLKKAIESLNRRQPTPDTNKSASEEVSLKMLQLNCFACHERGGRGGVGPDQWVFFENVQQVDIGDEGRLPPPLEHVGRKLSRDWIQKVLEGKGDVRPHFLARMPNYANHSKALATALVNADRIETNASSDPKVNNREPSKQESAEIQAAGRELFDSGCVQCHAFRGESLPGTIGIDLADVGIRIQREWFEAFLRNPAGLKKNTRMPTFFPDGKSAVPKILDGDAARQIDSLWAYFNAKDQPLPLKLEQSSSQSFELIPTDKPILIRTFMESASAGTHAIAVGLPQQIHFAFDTKQLRLSEIWKGRFLNAQGTWFDRFAPPASPLGANRITLTQTSFATFDQDGKLRLETSTAEKSFEKRFLGYRIDQGGIPIFRYSIGRFLVEDRIEAQGNSELKRCLKILSSRDGVTDPQERLWLVIADDAIEGNQSGVCSTRSKLNLRVSDGVESKTVQQQPATYWMVALDNRVEGIELVYQW
jgi:mono/diheme cytochrome c family protein